MNKMRNLPQIIERWAVWAHTPANDNWPVSDDIAKDLGKLLKTEKEKKYA